MSHTVLELVQEFCELRGLPVPSAVIGSNEKSVAQYRAVLKSLLRTLKEVHFPAQKIRATFAAPGTELQGVLTGLFPGYSALVPNTLWVEDDTTPVVGPLTDSEYAAIQVLDAAPLPYSYWLGGGSLYICPAPPEDAVISAVYTTDYVFSHGGAPVAEPEEDSDTILFPDDILVPGFHAHWLQVKGLPFANEWNTFLGAVARRKAESAPVLNMGSCNHGMKPGIVVPAGNWTV